MDKTNYLVKLALLLLLAFILQIQAQWIPKPFEPRPLCVSQYALANHACSLLPFEPNPPLTPPPSPSPSPSPSPKSPSPKSPPTKSPPPKSPPPMSPPPMSPLSPPPPFHKGMPPPPPHHKALPPPPSATAPPPPHHKGMPPPPPHHKHNPPPPPPTNQIRVSESGHRHRHRGHHGDGSPIEKECCKWLEGLDRECVCDLLVYLPVFLSKPVHIYNLKVGHACTVSYSCGSRIIGAESKNVTGTETKNVTRIY